MDFLLNLTLLDLIQLSSAYGLGAGSMWGYNWYKGRK